jgi:hypothetical protein
MNITIERHDGDRVVDQSFHAANLFDNEEEAVEHCIHFGHQIIDGQIPCCTAP